MRIVLCDDDPRILAQLEKCLAEYFQINHLPQPQYARYLDGESLLNSEEKVDIAFLDVEMTGLSGIHVGDRLVKRNPYTKIFILTSFLDYLDEAMKFHVFRYLSKPLDKNRLYRNLKEAIFQYEIETKPVVIETKYGGITCLSDEIVCVEAVNRKVLVHTIDETYEAVQPIKYWANQLSGGSFYQTHRSFIVNMKYVASFSKDIITLISPQGKESKAYLTKRNYSAYKNAYLLYMEAMR